MTYRIGLAIVLILIMCGAMANNAAEVCPTIDDKDIQVTHFEEMKYPRIGVTAHVQGIVVIRVTLDDEGKVTDAEALSGASVLVKDCLENVKKWQFRLNSEKSAVAVYHFQMVGLIKGDSFIPEGRNFATVLAESPLISVYPAQIKKN